MPNFDNVPIVDIHKDNFAQLWPSLLLAIKTASFIAIDTELSGLGNRRALQAKSVDDRYKGISAAAKSRSIISLGLSCFKLWPQSDSDTKIWKYTVQTFNIMTLCTEDYIVEPMALQFLVDHGFDFNKQYAQGVPYYKGNDKGDDTSRPTLRHLFVELIMSDHVLVFHNGLVDLVFLYHCCYAALPSQLGTFLTDIGEAISTGIYDTKYVAEFVSRSSVSYLEYLFRKLQRENVQKASKQSYVSVQFLDYSPAFPFIDYQSMGIDTTGSKSIAASQVCMTYANHGWCPNGRNCTLSHNVDCILDMEVMPCKKRRRAKATKEEVPNKKRNSSESLKSASLTDNTLDTCSGNDAPLALSVLCLKDSQESLDSGNNVDACAGDRAISCHQLKVHFAAVDADVSDSNEMPYMTTENGFRASAENTHEQEMLCANDSHQSAEVNGSSFSVEQTTVSHPKQNVTMCTNPATNVAMSDMTLRLGRKSNGHRAGCDAFMTGFAMACFLTNHGRFPQDVGTFKPTDTGTEEMINKVFLSGKDVPLVIQKSAFNKSSKSHQEKMQKLRSQEAET